MSFFFLILKNIWIALITIAWIVKLKMLLSLHARLDVCVFFFISIWWRLLRMQNFWIILFPISLLFAIAASWRKHRANGSQPNAFQEHVHFTSRQLFGAFFAAPSARRILLWNNVVEVEHIAYRISIINLVNGLRKIHKTLKRRSDINIPRQSCTEGTKVECEWRKEKKRT